jgi:hypothetical protein
VTLRNLFNRNLFNFPSVFHMSHMMTSFKIALALTDQDTQPKLPVQGTKVDLRATVQTWLEDLDTQTNLWGMEADLRATVQTWPEDLDTQTELWGWRRTLGLQSRPGWRIWTPNLNCEGQRPTLGLQPNLSHPQIRSPRLNCGDGG